VIVFFANGLVVIMAVPGAQIALLDEAGSLEGADRAVDGRQAEA